MVPKASKDSLYRYDLCNVCMGYQLFRHGDDPQKPIGKVFGRKLRKMNLQICLGDGNDCSFLRQKIPLSQLVWKQLLFVEEAKRMGIVVTAQEVESAVQGLAFQMFGGQVNVPRSGLLQFLCNNFRLNTEQIDRTIKRHCLLRNWNPCYDRQQK